MHELEKKSPSTRAKLERMFHLDYKEEGHPPPMEETQENGSSPSGTRGRNCHQKQLWLAFSLGVSVPIMIYIALVAIPPLLNYFSAWSSDQYHNEFTPAANSSAARSVPFTTAPADSSSAPFTAIPGLNATRSTLTGIVDPKTLSASYYWSMTLNNQNSSHRDQEARMEFSLPAGAVVSRATLWVNGRAEEAAFNATSLVQNGYQWVAVLHRDPLLVTKEPNGRILVQMSPVPAGGKEVRLQLGITAPISVKSSNTLRFSLPHLDRANFSMTKQDVHLQSPSPLYANSTRFNNTGCRGHFVFKGNVKPEELAALQLQVGVTKDVHTQFATRATHSDAGSYIVATLRKVEGEEEPQLTLEKALSRPDCCIVNSEEAAHRVSSLWAAQEIERLAETDHNTAVSLGTTYRVVSSVTGAVVLETEQDYKHSNLHRNRYQTLAYAPVSSPSSAPLANLNANSAVTGPETFEDSETGTQTMQKGQSSSPGIQGATNSYISARGKDASVVASTNTASSTSVDSLASLEAVLNAVANGMEILGIAWGGPTLIMGFMQMASGTQGAIKRVLWGAAGCSTGLAVPGCVNWLVASARDVNLFS